MYSFDLRRGSETLNRQGLHLVGKISEEENPLAISRSAVVVLPIGAMEAKCRTLRLRKRMLAL